MLDGPINALPDLSVQVDLEELTLTMSAAAGILPLEIQQASEGTYISGLDDSGTAFLVEIHIIEEQTDVFFDAIVTERVFSEVFDRLSLDFDVEGLAAEEEEVARRRRGLEVNLAKTDIVDASKLKVGEKGDASCGTDGNMNIKLSYGIVPFTKASVDIDWWSGDVKASFTFGITISAGATLDFDASATCEYCKSSSVNELCCTKPPKRKTHIGARILSYRLSK